MSSPEALEHLHFGHEVFEREFDREPFGFTHQLHMLDLFSPEALRRLTAKYERCPEDYFVSSSASTPGTRFFSVPFSKLAPLAALDALATGQHRILLKRLEDHDPQFRELLQQTFRQVIDQCGGLRGARVERLESALFISSGATITPFHFDPEINFFAQIEGQKRYHVYSPKVVSDIELERFYVRGKLEIGQIDLDGRDAAHEHVFQLGPGKGLHQPQNAPHWVETGATRSISYSIVFETDAMRAAGRARGCNHYLRKLGISPAGPGRSSVRDAMKSQAMLAVTPLRNHAGAILRGARGRGVKAAEPRGMP